MMHDVDYDKFTDDLKGLLSEADWYHGRLLVLKVRVCADLRDHGFISDERISMIRIRDGGNYERLIDLKPRWK